MHIPYYNPNLSREALKHGQADLTALTDLRSILASDLVQQEIAAGNLSFGMIRPELDDSVIGGGDDSYLAQMLESKIANLGVFGKFAVRFDNTAVDEFYSGSPKDNQITAQPLRHRHFPTRWDEFVANMTAGPTTALLLHTPDGTAIQTWRQQLGHWNIEAHRDYATLRGQFGIDNYSNLFHGSDSPESANREIDIILDLVMRYSIS